MRTMWEINADIVSDIYGECGEPIYECDWSTCELLEFYCPVCGFEGEDLEED